MRTVTKIVLGLFFAVIMFHVAAATVTYFSISRGGYVEGNPTTATLIFTYGLTPGLLLTLTQSTILTVVPLITYLASTKFSQLGSMNPPERRSAQRIAKYFLYPLASAVLIYLLLVAGADFTHDLALLLSHGSITTWTF